ncbi:hypothetical protein ACSBR1_025391 [Camellia fascicularis]
MLLQFKREQGLSSHARKSRNRTWRKSSMADSSLPSLLLLLLLLRRPTLPIRLRSPSRPPMSREAVSILNRWREAPKPSSKSTQEKAHYEAIQSQSQSQSQSQIVGDTDYEFQRRHNAELGRMQEEYSIRKEQARRATEDQIQALQCQTEKERAKMERETIRVKAIAEAEGWAHEAKLTEDHNRRMLIERISGEREKWLVAINTTFTHIEGGFRVLLTDRS